MKRPSFYHGVAVAAVLAFVASVVIAALTPFVGLGGVVRLMIPALSLAYILYLLRSSAERTGRIMTLSLWSALAVVTWWVCPPLSFYVLIHAGGIWLVRSLFFYSGILPALMDLGLSVLSVSAFVWVVSRTGSVFLATWSFFLVQAVFIAIPPAVGRQGKPAHHADNETFERARRQADDALRQLLSQ
jgi:hypothetical protein